MTKSPSRHRKSSSSSKKHTSSRSRSKSKSTRKHGKRHRHDRRRRHLSPSDDDYSSDSRSDGPSKQRADVEPENSSDSLISYDSSHSSRDRQGKSRHRRRRHDRHRSRRRDEDDEDSSNTSESTRKTKKRKRRRRDEDRRMDTTHKRRYPERRFVEALRGLLKFPPDLWETLLHVLHRTVGDGTVFDLTGMKKVGKTSAMEALESLLRTLDVLGIIHDSEGGGWSWKRMDVSKDFDDIFDFARHAAASKSSVRSEDTKLVMAVLRSWFDDDRLCLDEFLPLKRVLLGEHGDGNNANGGNTRDVTSGGDGANASSIKACSGSSTLSQGLCTGADNSIDPIKLKKVSVLEELKTFTKRLLYSSPLDSSLASELVTVFRHILEGNLVNVQNLVDPTLKVGLRVVFTRIGLLFVPMEEESIEGKGCPPTFGFGLPLPHDENRERARTNLVTVMELCQSIVKEVSTATSTTRAAVIGPSRPTKAMVEIHEDRANFVKEMEEEDDDDAGPLPVDQMKRIKASSLRWDPPPMVQGALANASANVAAREDWMMSPGEGHTLLEEIIRQPTKERKFRNVKSSDRGSQLDDNDDRPRNPNPALEKQKAMLRVYAEARGPSLLDQHKQKKAEEALEKKRKHGDQTKWKWDRERDLDAGRRVDKDALNNILGGAAKFMSDKFRNESGV